MNINYLGLERAMMDEAGIQSGSIPVLLGDELIDAARELVAACETRNRNPDRLRRARRAVYALVGSADES